MGRKSVKQKAIEHYERMIEWVKKRPKRNIPDSFSMELDIGESWYGEYCSYCEKYYDYECEDEDEYEGCPKCPLSNSGKRGFTCCDGLWKKMDEAKTWGTWIKYAEKTLEYIKEQG